jgi:hypothetical protein
MFFQIGRPSVFRVQISYYVQSSDKLMFIYFIDKENSLDKSSANA